MFKYTLLLVALASGVAGLSTKAATRPPNPAIKAMATGMGLLAPAFVAEAKIQASVLGSKIDMDEVAKEIDSEIGSNKIVVYTYGLSPFSAEAVAMLDNSGYDYTQIELGAEWFLLNGKDSVKRVALSERVENGATSLPKVFVNNQCIGGCKELADAVESGYLDQLVATPKQKNKLFPFL